MSENGRYRECEKGTKGHTNWNRKRKRSQKMNEEDEKSEEHKN